MKRSVTIFFVCAVLASLSRQDAHAQVDYQDMKEFHALASFENISFMWNGDANKQLLFNEGINNLNERNLVAAIDNFSKLLSTIPNFYVALYYRGICFRLQNDLIRARKDFDKLIEVKNDLPQAYLEMSKVKIQVGFNNEAIEYLTTCIQKFPTYVSAYYLMGENYLLTNELEKAKTYFEACQKFQPSFLAPRVKLGLIELAIREDTQVGLEIFNEVIQQDSLQKEALWCRATICFRSEPKKSIRDFNTLVRQNPNSSLFRFQRGLVRAELGEIDGAWSDFKTLADVPVPKSVPLSIAAGKFISLQSARNYLVRVIHGLNDNDKYTIKNAFCLLVLGQDHEAIRVLKENQIESSACWQYLSGIASQNLGLHQEAQQYYRSALQFDNDLPDVHQKLGIYMLESKKLKAAATHFNEMIRINPGEKSGYYLRSIANYRLADYKLAIKDANTVLSMDSLDCDAYNVLGHSYIAVKKILPAFEVFNRCHNSEIYKLDLIEFHKSIFRLLKSGDTLKALFYLDKMTDLRPLYELGTRLKIELLSEQKKWTDLQYFLIDRRNKFVSFNSEEYKEYINEELIRVEKLQKKLETANKKN